MWFSERIGEMVDVLIGVPILMEGDACLIMSPGTLMWMVVFGVVATQYIVIRALVIPTMINPLMIALFRELFLVCLVLALFTVVGFSLCDFVVSSEVSITLISLFVSLIKGLTTSSSFTSVTSLYTVEPPLLEV